MTQHLNCFHDVTYTHSQNWNCKTLKQKDLRRTITSSKSSQLLLFRNSSLEIPLRKTLFGAASFFWRYFFYFLCVKVAIQIYITDLQRQLLFDCNRKINAVENTLFIWPMNTIFVIMPLYTKTYAIECLFSTTFYQCTQW